MSFHVGQKVVCVADLAGQGPGIYRWPNSVRTGGVYVVRSIEALHVFTLLKFEEFLAPLDTQGREPGFCSDYFRPVTEKKTDISTFTDILDRVNNPQREPVSQ